MKNDTTFVPQAHSVSLEEPQAHSVRIDGVTDQVRKVRKISRPPAPKPARLERKRKGKKA